MLIKTMPKKYLLLDSIRSLLNVGALFRTADAAGFDRIYLTGITPTPPRKEIAKTALGAESSVEWEFYEDSMVIIRELKDQGVKIISLEQDERSVDYRDIILPEGQDCCLVLGNEIDGVSTILRDASDSIVELPMHGMKQSLNVATAGGILMYKIMELGQKPL